ncbi:MAG: hypothetical protein CL483_08820 [Acidobacteria bacterium]|nr:hypothetical protein [Acidobacteriota bacterium]
MLSLPSRIALCFAALAVACAAVAQSLFRTVGRICFTDTADDLEEIYDKVGVELADRYALGHGSSDPITDGSWRRVEVTLASPELSDPRIRAREGYFVPWIEHDEDGR